jgi:hypothetical protein
MKRKKMKMYMKNNKKEENKYCVFLHVTFHLCSSQNRESKQILSFTTENVPTISCTLLVQLPTL